MPAESARTNSIIIFVVLRSSFQLSAVSFQTAPLQDGASPVRGISCK
ncbi:hypothetical protein SBA5_430033 [Candidatus Sulfotelmatomonas gaucii]|uniref:Uncharacterized protein n=1 Tax=Candidatus Sulfuritelmatomonas gaucii TaxID=2043161 RepID=A0A2N9LLY1_9BACT|nr:hypothetical protein SBA5_430033 [Candidatus Sulfotelmatomonas gaucii]